MIIEEWSRPHEENGYKGMRHMFMVGEHPYKPVGDFTVDCYPECAIIHARPYNSRPSTIRIMQKVVPELLYTYLRDEMDYYQVYVPGHNQKLVAAMAREVKEELKRSEVDFPDGTPLYYVDLQTIEDYKQNKYGGT